MVKRMKKTVLKEIPWETLLPDEEKMTIAEIKEREKQRDLKSQARLDELEQAILKQFEILQWIEGKPGSANHGDFLFEYFLNNERFKIEKSVDWVYQIMCRKCHKVFEVDVKSLVNEIKFSQESNLMIPQEREKQRRETLSRIKFSAAWTATHQHTGKVAQKYGYCLEDIRFIVSVNDQVKRKVISDVLRFIQLRNKYEDEV